MICDKSKPKPTNQISRTILTVPCSDRLVFFSAHQFTSHLLRLFKFIFLILPFFFRFCFYLFLFSRIFVFIYRHSYLEKWFFFIYLLSHQVETTRFHLVIINVQQIYNVGWYTSHDETMKKYNSKWKKKKAKMKRT